MKKLIIMRHGQAPPVFGKADFERPLSQGGRDDVRHNAELMQQQGHLPQLIIASAALRTKQSCEEAIVGLGNKPASKFKKSLYQEGNEGYLAAISKEADKEACVMLIGHNPTVSSLASHLGRDEGTYFGFTPASYAVFEFPELDSWMELTLDCKAKLIHFH